MVAGSILHHIHFKVETLQTLTALPEQAPKEYRQAARFFTEAAGRCLHYPLF